MKMLAHAKTGVEKGLAADNRMPVEVMGFLHCSIDPADPHTIVCVCSAKEGGGRLQLHGALPCRAPGPYSRARTCTHARTHARTPRPTRLPQRDGRL
jgi:hypothetical protein